MTARSLLQRLTHVRQLSYLPRVVLAVALLGLLAFGTIKAMNSLRPPLSDLAVPGQEVTWGMAKRLAKLDGVLQVSAAFIPNDRIWLYSRVTQPDRAQVRTWAQAQLKLSLDQFASLPTTQKLTWVIDFGAPPGEQEVITVNLGQITSSDAYSYVSAKPGFLTNPPVAAQAPAVPQPTAAPKPAAQATAVPQPTAAPKPAAQATAVPQPTAAPKPAAQATAAPQAAQAQPAAAAETVLYNVGFDDPNDVKSWRILGGDWQIGDGMYRQHDAKGYDLIAFANQPPQRDYRLETKFRLQAGTMGGGVIYHAPAIDSRAGAQVVDLDKQGTVLRWGQYDDKGAYVYQGSVALPQPLNDANWHVLTLLNRAEQTIVQLDGREVAKFQATRATGHYGLVTSLAQVDFASMKLVALTAGTPPVAAPPAPAAAPAAAAPATSLRDDFASGDMKTWRVLSGTWQNTDGVYQQNDLAGSDHGSITSFQTVNFSATVRLKQLEGDMGAGLYFSMAKRESKSQSQMINYTQGGKVMQWGHFDEGGNFVFEGSAPVSDGNDGAWHQLRVEVQDGKASFWLDGQQLAKEVKLTYAQGYIGLLVSHSKVAFDDLRIEAR